MIVENFRAYFEAFTGSASWEGLEHHFERVLHDDLTVKTANGELDREGWKESVKMLLNAGATQLNTHSLQAVTERHATLSYPFIGISDRPRSRCARHNPRRFRNQDRRRYRPSSDQPLTIACGNLG